MNANTIAIQELIEAHRGANMFYQGLKDKKPLARTVLPYTLVETKDGRQYMWAYDAVRKDARTFRVDRISSLEARGKTVEFPEYARLAKGTKLEHAISGGTVIATVMPSRLKVEKASTWFKVEGPETTHVVDLR